jgi:hypothetical protein
MVNAASSTFAVINDFHRSCFPIAISIQCSIILALCAADEEADESIRGMEAVSSTGNIYTNAREKIMQNCVTAPNSVIRLAEPQRIG